MFLISSPCTARTCGTGLICFAMRKWMLFFTMAFYSHTLFSQYYFNKLFDTPFPYVGAILRSIEAPDSGFILMHTSFDVFKDTNAICIVKINKYGDTVWKRSYGAVGTAHEQYEIIRTEDSCYVFCGGEWKNDTLNAFLFKINEQGDSLWMKTYNPGGYLCYFETVIETFDGGFLATGGYNKDKINGTSPSRQAYTIKTDKEGNVQWSLLYGDGYLNEAGIGLVETPDHGYLQSGYAGSPTSSDFYVYPQLIKIKNNGQIAWIKNYSDPDYYWFYTQIKRTLDGNYLISGGYANDEDVFPSDPYGNGGTLTKIDEDGNVLWFKRYGDEIYDAECYDFVELPDSSIVTIGFNHQPWEKSTLVKFNSQGTIIWKQQYLYNSEFESNEALFEIIHTKDNGFLMTGYAHNPELDTTGFSIGKGWILKVDSLGCPMPLCVVATEEPGLPTLPAAFLEVFPNPTSGTVEVRWNPREGTGTLEVFNINGTRLMLQQVALQGGSNPLSLDGQPAGVYVVRLRTSSGSVTHKLIIE